MKKILNSILYLVPYIFLGIYIDIYSKNSMGYLISLIILVTLQRCWIKNNSIKAIVLGNVVSLLTSYICVINYIGKEWNWYIKPFTPTGLLICVFIVFVIAQCVIGYLFFYNLREKRR